MNTFLKLETHDAEEMPLTFGELNRGELFWYSGSLYVKTDGVVTAVINYSYYTCKYNAFNLRTLKVGQYSKNTKVYRVTAEPLKYKIHKVGNVSNC